MMLSPISERMQEMLDRLYPAAAERLSGMGDVLHTAAAPVWDGIRVDRNSV